MENLRHIRSIESRSFPEENRPDRRATIRIVWLFVIVVLGILASWFWGIGWEYLSDTSKPLVLGPFPAIFVRVILAFIIAAVSFTTMYTKINQNTRESWIPYFLAFQNGFFWDAIFQGIAQTFRS